MKKKKICTGYIHFDIVFSQLHKMNNLERFFNNHLIQIKKEIGYKNYLIILANNISWQGKYNTQEQIQILT
jgi:hypothetical protein